MLSQKKKKRRLYYIIAAIGAVVVIGLFAVIRQLNAPEPEDYIFLENLSPPPNAEGKAWGPVDAPVLIEEYGDFQWPFCGLFATGAGRQLEETYADSGQVRFEYKHFAFLGGESSLAAEASECANEQSQFWPYHDTIFANQKGENLGRFSKDGLKLLAAGMGLDENEFNSCLDSGRHRSTVQNETTAARTRGVGSTPTIFFNGEKIETGFTFDALQAMIEDQLAAVETESQ